MKKNARRANTKPDKTYTFWQAVKAIRIAKGLTQDELAEAISETADAPWISRVEAGKKDISLRTALRIVEALDAEITLNGYRILNTDG
jgi:transcriptional regulator with XRE-family HTH domain